MSADPKRVKEIFLEAAELPDEAARAAFLDRACGGDAGLRGRVEALLRSHDPDGSFLGTPAAVIPDPEHAGTVAFRATPDPDHDSTRTSDGSSGSAEDDEALAFLTPSTRPDSLGRIGHYEVLQVLGRGGFGIVFRAFDDVLQRVVAVKVMAPQLAATSPARKRFLREARTSAQVRHENVVQVYEVAESPLPFLVMEYIPGETLQQRLNRVGPVEPAEVVRVGHQIAEGLAAAHATDLIHRDIKPGNILLEGGHLKVKITDFGLARAADDASISQSGIIAGTPMYMAPEQAKGEKLDHRADLFSLGSVLYQMVSGRAPFRANSTVAVLKRVADDNPRDIREIIPETPQWLCDIIAKLHAKDPDDRYQSAREVADVLADCEAQLKANSKLKDYSRIPRGKPQRSGRRKWVAAAAVLLLPVIALAVTESAGVTQLFRAQNPATTNPIPGGNESLVATATGWHGWPADAPMPATAPFDAARARTHQEAWAKYLGVPVEYTNSLGMKFVLVPPGEFTMGATEEEAKGLADRLADNPDLEGGARSTAPAHPVRLTRPFYLSRHEVRQQDYQAVIGTNPSGWTKTGARPELAQRVAGLDTGTFPVDSVSWQDAAEFCTRLSEKEKVQPVKWVVQDLAWRPKGEGYRLPTEAEWELACRAGTTTRFAVPDTQTVRVCYSGENSGNRPHAVGELSANAFGLFDMHGNLAEWVQDSWEPDDYRRIDGRPVTDPCGPASEGSRRAIRGGGWGVSSSVCTSFIRHGHRPEHYAPDTGFRVALSVEAVKAATANRTPSPLPPTFTNGIGMEFVRVPKGKSWLGGGKDKLGDREVEIPADFYLGKYEVTQEEWTQVMGENPSHFSRTGEGKDAVKDIPDAELKRFPVEMVSWDQCQVFVAKLNKREMETGWVYRLPTEMEWEYACRGGPMVDRRDSAFDFYLAEPTNLLLPAQANFAHGDGTKRTCKVGSFAPNRLGLHDMHGNVMEWCDDDFDPRKGLKLTRGGDCTNTADKLVFRFRWGATANSRYPPVGLRLARVPAGAASPEAKSPPPAVTQFADADVQRIAALPAAEQVEEVRKELVRRNPGFDGKITHKIEGDVVTEFAVNTNNILDVSPVRALTGLVYLDLRGTYPNKGRLIDLSPLKGMKLSKLDCSSTQIADLTPLAGVPLTVLHVNHNPVSDLTPLKAMPLESLGIAETKVSDLTPLRGLKLKNLGAQLLPVTDLSPLEGMPLTELDLYHTVGVTNLDALKGMPLEGLNLHDVPVSDLSPLKGMTTLRTLHLCGNRVTDVSPLAGLKLTDLILHDKQITDLSPLKGLPLTRLVIYNAGVTDLTPLQGMPLQEVRLNPKNITEGLDVLRGIKSLKIIGTGDGPNQVWPPAEFWERYDKGEFTK